jgi:hypothetical protein
VVGSVRAIVCTVLHIAFRFNIFFFFLRKLLSDRNFLNGHFHPNFFSEFCDSVWNCEYPNCTIIAISRATIMPFFCENYVLAEISTKSFHPSVCYGITWCSS